MELPVVETWTRFEDSLQWRLHDTYYAQRGTGAWLEHEIPYLSTSNIAQARHMVRIYQALVAQAERARQLEAVRDRAEGDDVEDLAVLEIGAGSCHFAASFTRALAEADPELAARTHFIASDYATKGLRQAAEAPYLKEWVDQGRVVLARYDASRPGELYGLEGERLSMPGFVMVVANYVCSAIAMSPLQKRADTWHELWVETRAFGEINDDAGLAVLAHRPGAHGLLEHHNDWRAVDAQVALGPIHAAAVAAAVGDEPYATLSYPRRYFDFLMSFPALVPGGAFVTCDYGHLAPPYLRGLVDKPPQQYGNSLGQPVMFGVFAPFARAAGMDIALSKGVTDRLHLAVLGREPLSRALRESLDEGRVLGSAMTDLLLDFVQAARLLSREGESLSATRFLERCVRIDPTNPQYRSDLADVALDEGLGALALEHIEVGQRLAPGGFDWHFMRGRAHYLCGELDRARAAYEDSLAEVQHPQTYRNLAAVYGEERRFPEAFECIRRALALAPGDHRTLDSIHDLERRLKILAEAAQTAGATL